jgi:hypothetical protein
MKILTGFAIVLFVLTTVISGYLFYVAQVRSEKDFVDTGVREPGEALYEQQTRWQALPKEDVTLETADGLTLKGEYVKAEKPSKKIVIVIHGFSVDRRTVVPYSELMHSQGYNVLSADNRAAGKSEGTYIGYGYLEAKDYLAWINQLIAEHGEDTEIVVYGTSLGAATTMLLAGMNPPSQVKAFIEDCGYNDLREELNWKGGQMYKLPSWILEPFSSVLSIYSQLLAGYSYNDVRPEKSLENNTRPMLFIHGAEDLFVPTSMVHKVYDATKGPKEKLVVPGADHMEAYEKDEETYVKTVSDFLAKYV